MPSKKRSLTLALVAAIVAVLSLQLADRPAAPTATDPALPTPPVLGSSPPPAAAPNPQQQPPLPQIGARPSIQAPPPSPRTVRLIKALDRGYPFKLTVAGRSPLTFVTSPRQLLAPEFQLTLGLDTTLKLATPPRVSDARAISATGSLTATRASITVVGDAVTAIVEHASGAVTAIKTHPETGQLHALEIPAGHLVAACHHDFDAGIATASSDTPLPTDEQWLAGPLAQLEPDIANAGGIDPGTGRLDKYVEPIPFGQNYDRSLADMVMTIVLDKDATGSASTNNLTNKASEYLARMANVASVHEHQLGIKTIVGELLLTPDTDDYTDVPASLGNFRSWVGSNRARGTYRWNACAKFGQTGTSGGTIGVAYVSALSGGNGVSVNNKGFTHALVAHETGHNMGSGHSSGGIMNPSIISGSRTFFNDVSAGETAAKDIYDHTRSRIYGDATMRHPEQIPFANDDDRTTAVNTEHRFDPTANDARTVRNGTANTTLTVEETSRVNPLHAGTVAVEGNEVVFTPSQNYQGLAHFSYSLRGDVGNGGQGWLHKGDVGMQVGSFNANSLNLTLAPGQHFSFRPSGSANPSISSQPQFAHVGTSRDDRRLIIIRVDAAATGTDTFTFTRDGDTSTVRISYLEVDDFLALQDDVFTVGGTGSTIEFNPLVNDQGAGYLSPVSIAPTLNIDEPATAFYFRHRFDTGDLSGPSPLSFDFLRDDGIVVYLNGAELFRDNMPAGAVTPDTLADASIGGADESAYNSRNITATLVPGENTIAVEVHQASTTSSDLGFDLSLSSRGQTLIPRGSDWRFLDGGASPDPASTWKSNVYDGGNFTLTSFGPDASDKHITTYFRSTFQLADPAAFTDYTADIRVDDGAVVYINGQEAFRDNMPGGTVNFNTTSAGGANNNGANLTAYTIPSNLLVAGTNSIAVEVHQTGPTSSDIVLDLELTAGAATTLLPLNATWRYNDTGTDLGTAWRAPAFDDVTWPASTAPFGYPARGVVWQTGTAIFGFGDDLETTPVNSGATGLQLLPGAFRIISATNLTPAKGSLDTSATIPVTIDGRRQDVFTGDLKFTPANGASGIATIEYTAEDGAGNRRTATVSIVLPLVEITSPSQEVTVIDSRNGLILQGSNLDAGVTFTWSAPSAPDGATVSFETPDARTTAARFSAPGVYTIRLDGTKDTFTTGEEITVVVEDSTLAVSPVGLVAHWTFDEGTGIFADDASGNGHFGTLIDGVPWTTGLAANAVNFNASSAYIDLTEHLDHFRDLDRGTIACWFRTNTGSERTIFSASDSGDPLRDLRLYIDDSFLKYKVRGDVGTSGSSINTGVAVNDNRWHHAAVTVDAARNATLYLDGEPFATGVRPFFSGVFDLDSLRIGNVVHSNSAEFPYRGDVDDLRVYNRPLSPEEIALLAGAAAGRAPRITLPDTVAVSPTSTFPLGTLAPAVTFNSGLPTTLWIDPGNNPAVPVFASAPTPGTDVTLPAPGSYTLRLTATGLSATTFDDTTVTRTASPPGTPATLGIPGIVTHQNAADTTVSLWPVFFDPATRRSDILTYTLESITDPSLFTAATVAGTPDVLTLAYAPAASGTSELTVRATAPGGAFVDTTFSVTVENAAPAVARQSFGVAEGAPNGTRVGLVAATDIDRDPLNFRLIADPSNGAFHLDPATGALTVVDTSRLDFETGASLPLTVLVTDPQHTNPGTLATISLNLTDSNETPSISDLNVDLPEASPAGTTVATLSASDPDGGNLSFAIVGGNTGNAFEIDEDNGFLSVRSSAPLNTTLNPRFTLSVQVTDDGDPALSAVATVRVTLQSTLLAENATARYRVPTSAAEGTTWRARSFDDASWTTGRYGFGYDTAGDYDDLIDTDLEDSMFESAASLYLRSTFTVADPDSLTKLLLRVRYDDGFVAYLNGVEIAAENEPGTPAWDSTATGSHSDSEAVEFEDFDVTRYLNRLATGTNVIAFHAMNRATDNSDFLFVPQLVASATGTAELPDPPSLNLSSAIGVTTSTARLRGVLDANGGENPEIFFAWGTTDGGSSLNSWQNTSSVGDGIVGNGYSLNLSGLSSGTTYYFNVFATNAGGTASATSRSFTTTAVPADTLIAETAPATSLVPTDASLATTWLAADFDDTSWKAGRSGVGYETGNGYQDLIRLDLESEMFDTNASAYIRIPFDAPGADLYDNLTLRMQYDDGFVAYLNGIEIARRNAPPGQPFHNSAATANHDDSDATVFEDIDVSQFRGALRTTGNLLAVHGLNAGIDSSDFLIIPVLEAADTDGTANPTLPALELTPANDVAGRSATIGGILSSTGGQRPQLTVYWGTANAGNDPAAWQHSTTLGSLAAGSFAATPSDLLPETTYFFTARATNNAGATWTATPQSFTTSTAAPVTTTLIDAGYPAVYLTPTDGLLGNTWTAAAFDDSAWSNGNAGFGFHTAGTYDFLLGTDLIAARRLTPSLYVRSRFDISDRTALTSLTLRLKYDDAFVAYLNGIEVARSTNAPANLAWNATASATRPVDTAVLFEPFDIPLAAVANGRNTLAIHTLNRSASDPEFLLVPELLATSVAPLIDTPLGYDTWTTTFGLTGPGADLAADPDFDGLINLLEFALISSPVTPSASPLTIIPSADGTSLLLTFTRRTGVSTTVESSTTGTAWQPAGNVTTLSVTPLPGNTAELVTLSVPKSTTTEILRLNVTL